MQPLPVGNNSMASDSCLTTAKQDATALGTVAGVWQTEKPDIPPGAAMTLNRLAGTVICMGLSGLQARIVFVLSLEPGGW